MFRHSFKWVFALFALLAVLSLAALPVSAHTRTVPSNTGSARPTCHSLSVHLNGTAPATVKCLDKQLGPDIGKTGCGSNTLIIYADAGFSGWNICFSGWGSTDMTSYWVNPFWNWNDQASSYISSCNSGVFYADTGQRGQQQPFANNQQANFDGQNGHLPNDSLSSVYISSPC